MNSHDIRINRRDFLKWTGLAAAGITISATIGCEGGDDNGTDAGTYSDKSGSISSNIEGHTVTLTAAQQEAGNAVTLTLTTGGGHSHTVRFSAAEVQSIANGGSATHTSSTDAATGHNHVVSFS